MDESEIFLEINGDSDGELIEIKEQKYKSKFNAFKDKFLYSTFIKFPYKICKLLFQLEEFYLCVILTNIIIEFNLIFVCVWENFLLKIIGFFQCSLFTYYSSYILAIYYYEFSQLSWLKYSNFYYSIGIKESFQSKKKDDRYPIIIIALYFNIIIILYTIYFFFNKWENLLIMMFTILFFFYPLTKFILIYFRRYQKGEIFYETQINSNNENDKKKFKISLFFYIISFLINILLYLKNSFNISGILFIICIYIFIFPSVNMSIHPWIIHTIYKRCFCCTKDYINKKTKTQYSKINKKSKGFKNWFNFAFIFYIIILLIFLLSIIEAIFIKPEKQELTVQKIFNKTKNFTGIPEEKKNPLSKNILSSLCYTEIQSLNFIQLTSLTSASYLLDEIDKEYNIINILNKSIFNKTKNNLKISKMKFLTNRTENPTILQTDIEIPNKTPLTIISIKGTSNTFDMWLDIEMFLTSALLNFAKSFPLLFELEKKIISYYTTLATLPLRYLNNITLTNKYIELIDEKYNNLISKNGYSENNRTYIFTGHSLGGGLAKFIAFKKKKLAFSVSSPGISPWEFILKSNNESYDMNLRNSIIDIVPELDIVPRVELSSGVQYKVLCQKGIFSCHEIIRTICMMGTMCKMEYLTKDLCLGVYKYEEYQNDFVDVVYEKDDK